MWAPHPQFYAHGKAAHAPLTPRASATSWPPSPPRRGGFGAGATAGAGAGSPYARGPLSSPHGLLASPQHQQQYQEQQQQEYGSGGGGVSPQLLRQLADGSCAVSRANMLSHPVQLDSDWEPS
ncbi:hypothetical protein CHLRE_04g224899v5 [Chlamydomonas reinhardtii]|uniref:Uncharacterized protein n=1 Tax=Chlamydomonas reinhardtii TaxID=3055 RepID=A0A2K3DUI6_CHLRE|nr:uncharacterized protein CHLRE_04g224899v5 [Chlamydomonas reinhardtii]PNW84193.1 hypothetical protein CHLRE_04g224899v5 [Chlamydomonas reinhardtii]